MRELREVIRWNETVVFVETELSRFGNIITGNCTCDECSSPATVGTTDTHRKGGLVLCARCSELGEV